jgi:small subunit ribosomal protein S21
MEKSLIMPSVTPKHKYETIEQLLRRFKRSVERADVIKDIRKKEFFEKPTSKRKRKKAAAKKRYQKQEAMQRNKFSKSAHQRRR